MLIFGPKNVLVRYFWARISKKLLSFIIQHPQIYLIPNFAKKMPKFVSKNHLFGYFGPKMSYLDGFWDGIKKNIVIFEISESLNLSCRKFCCKNKDPQI